ncbi:hypothetical protein HHK36_005663 [Tetracentron sinense]|uniref:NAC domain-containing protein n=1 Tax=Tetracentron sinense TaxID=13715 RepID=A0A834ZPW1_TETSI|nr:hypothetical protein HHK36_005663 [Tetracentron sinense]
MSSLMPSSSSSLWVQQLQNFPSPPPGYRFRPTDSELVVYYLKNKMLGRPLPANIIEEYNVYSCSPDQLTRDLFSYGKENEFYFFTQRNRKSTNGSRPNRAAGDGFWKASSGYSNVKDDRGRVVGKKRSLVFHIGKSSNTIGKTKWLMQEFLVDTPTTANGVQKSNWVSTKDSIFLGIDFVLCKVYLKKSGCNKPQAGMLDGNGREEALPVATSFSTDPCIYCPNQAYVHPVSVSTEEMNSHVGMQTEPAEGAFHGGNEYYLNQASTSSTLAEAINNAVGLQAEVPIDQDVFHGGNEYYLNQASTSSTLAEAINNAVGLQAEVPIDQDVFHGGNEYYFNQQAITSSTLAEAINNAVGLQAEVPIDQGGFQGGDENYFNQASTSSTLAEAINNAVGLQAEVPIDQGAFRGGDEYYFNQASTCSASAEAINNALGLQTEPIEGAFRGVNVFFNQEFTTTSVLAQEINDGVGFQTEPMDRSSFQSGGENFNQANTGLVLTRETNNNVGLEAESVEESLQSADEDDDQLWFDPVKLLMELDTNQCDCQNGCEFCVFFG